jgi:hypothetical protein
LVRLAENKSRRTTRELVIHTENLWQCPKCGRLFANKGQSHSCISYSIYDHFQGKPASLRQTFDFLLTRISQFGPFRTDSVKSAINITARFHFVMLYVLRNSLKLEFALDRKLNSERITKTQKLGANRYSYFVKVADKEDIDDQLLSWLKEAYSQSG